MIDLFQITNDPDLARACDAMPGFRVFVDLERNGKAVRQAGRNTFISVHTMADVSRIKAVVQRSAVMVRLNPWHSGSATEVEEAIAHGADRLMLPMFKTAVELQQFCDCVAGRVPVTPLLECREALDCLAEWVDLPGFDEVFLGLNDLHLSLGHQFMYEALALGIVDRVAGRVQAAGKRFGFGGIARMQEGELPGRLVLAEHLRLKSSSVIVSRTFHRLVGPGADKLPSKADSATSLIDFASEIRALRDEESRLSTRDPVQVEHDRCVARDAISRISTRMRQRVPA